MSLLDVQTVPRMFKVRQEFPRPEPLDIPATVAAQIASVQDRLQPNARVAVTVGSRGIANLREIVRAVLDALKAAGVQPFILPAMGSHGLQRPAKGKYIIHKNEPKRKAAKSEEGGSRKKRRGSVM